MRGRNIDNDFVMSFIQDCAVNGKDTPEDICAVAVEKINEIDKQLKLRVKLSDVLSFFSYKKKNQPIIKKEKVPSFKNIDQKFVLEVFDVAYGKTTDEFISYVSKINDKNNLTHKENLIFTLKTLLSKNILYRNENNFIVDGKYIKEYYASLS